MVTPLFIIAASGSFVDLDFSFLVQFAVFVIVFFALKWLLFSPVLRLIEARREATEGFRGVAHQLDEQAHKLGQDIDRRLLDIRQAASLERSGAVEQARREGRELLAKAREQAKALVDRATLDAAKQGERARNELRGEVQVLAEMVTSRALGRES